MRSLLYLIRPTSVNPGFSLRGGAPLMNDFTDRRVKQILKANTEKKTSSRGRVGGKGFVSPDTSPRSAPENSMMQQLSGKYCRELSLALTQLRQACVHQRMGYLDRLSGYLWILLRNSDWYNLIYLCCVFTN